MYVGIIVGNIWAAKGGVKQQINKHFFKHKKRATQRCITKRGKWKKTNLTWASMYLSMYTCKGQGFQEVSRSKEASPHGRVLFDDHDDDAGNLNQNGGAHKLTSSQASLAHRPIMRASITICPNTPLRHICSAKIK